MDMRTVQLPLLIVVFIVSLFNHLPRINTVNSDILKKMGALHQLGFGPKQILERMNERRHASYDKLDMINDLHKSGHSPEQIIEKLKNHGLSVTSSSHSLSATTQEHSNKPNTTKSLEMNEGYFSAQSSSHPQSYYEYHGYEVGTHPASQQYNLSGHLTGLSLDAPHYKHHGLSHGDITTVNPASYSNQVLRSHRSHSTIGQGHYHDPSVTRSQVMHGRHIFSQASSFPTVSMSYNPVYSDVMTTIRGGTDSPVRTQSVFDNGGKQRTTGWRGSGDGRGQLRVELPVEAKRPSAAEQKPRRKRRRPPKWVRDATKNIQGES